MREKEVRNTAYATMGGINLGEPGASINRNKTDLFRKRRLNTEERKRRTKRVIQRKMSLSNAQL